MASTILTPTAQLSDAPALNDNTRGNIRRGRGGVRGGALNGHRGSRRGGGTNRGDRTMGNKHQRERRVSGPENRPALPIPPPPGLGGGGSFGDRLTEDAENVEGEGGGVQQQQEDQKEDDVEAEVCFICASEVEHNSVAPCNHRTCHICALRLRALYKTRACAHCRVGNYHPSRHRMSSLTHHRQNRNSLSSRTTRLKDTKTTEGQTSKSQMRL